MKIALTVGGSDPSGGAGIQADLKTFQALGVYGVSLTAELTAQSTEGISEIFHIPLDFFERQFDTLLGDVRPDSVKTGMLARRDAIRITGEMVKKYSLKNLVIDPVALSSTGVRLIEDDALERIRDDLFPLARAVTPNMYEASLLTGLAIHDEEDMKKAAVKIREQGPANVIVTGGHGKETATDLFFDGHEFLFLQREKVAGEHHGTGCIFSSALAAGYALGLNSRECAVRANDFVWKRLGSALSIGRGMKVLNI